MTTTLNKSYQSKPITVPQGGSTNASLTPYSLLAGGTTGTAAIQSAGAGTSGQVYVSAGAASLGAFTAQNQIGAWFFISTGTASSSATIDFTGLTSTFNTYKVIVSAIVPATNATDFQMLVSSNNGSSYDSGAGNYGYASLYSNDTGAAAIVGPGSTSATAIQIAPSLSSTASYCNNFEITLVDFPTSRVNNGPFWAGKFKHSTADSVTVWGEGSRLTTQVNNAIRFKMSSGNISTGTFKLYGLLL